MPFALQHGAVPQRTDGCLGRACSAPGDHKSNIHLAGAGAIALFAASRTTGPKSNQSPVPGDSTVATRTDSRGCDSLGGRITEDSASAAVRHARDASLDARRRTTHTVTILLSATADSAGAGARSTLDSVGGNMRTTIVMKSTDGRDLGSLNLMEAAQALSISGTLRSLPPGAPCRRLPPAFSTATSR